MGIFCVSVDDMGTAEMALCHIASRTRIIPVCMLAKALEVTNRQGLGCAPCQSWYQDWPTNHFVLQAECYRKDDLTVAKRCLQIGRIAVNWC
jgi:hypothetical protein